MGGKPTAFQCPLEKVVDFAGFGFGSTGFHPFVETLRIRESFGEIEAEAFLKRFYARYQPENAAEAFLGFQTGPRLFRQSEPHLHHLAPWVALSPVELSEKVRRWVTADNLEHGSTALKVDPEQFPMHGPVTAEKVHLEFQRLQRLAESVKNNGYDRAFGDCFFVAVRRGDDFRFLPYGGGYHRTATMAALGYDWVPGRILDGPVVFDCADVDYWTQVRRGIWTKVHALAYVDYLFDYTSRQWYLDNWNESSLVREVSPSK